MKTIRLYGHLGEKYGKVHRLDVKSPAEAVRALCSLYRDFKDSLVKHSHAAGGYRVVVGRTHIDKNSLLYRYDDRESIRIVPVLCGAGKNGTGQTILGVIMVIVGVFSTTYGGSGVISAGLSMMAGGISQMLAKPPTTQGTPERPDNKPSYVFDGAVNTTAQGNPVPLCYGRLIVGSQVISAGLTVEQI